jgi:hypothetical protein
MMWKHKYYRWASYFAISLLLVGCTVSYSFTGASIPIEAKTFTIRDISNVAPTINPSLATDLEYALTEKLLRQTRLAETNFDGDLIYDITIIGYTVTPTAVTGGEDARASLNRLTIRAKVKFQNRYDKEANFERTFSKYADFDSSNNFMDEEEGLVLNIIDQLVIDIFNASVANW